MAHALDIQDVRFGVHPDKTRMVVELSQAPVFKAFILPPAGGNAAPYRLIVDLPEFEWRAGTINRPPKTTIQDVRSGPLVPGIKRLVIDLSKPALLDNAFIIPANKGTPTRLVVDYRTVNISQYNAVSSKVLGTLIVPDNKNVSLIDSIIGSAIPQETPSTEAAANNNGIITPARKPQTITPTFKGAQLPPPQTPLRKPLIVIDAGHGGADPGAIGTNNAREKNVTLAAAKELKKTLEATGRYRVELTRHNDTYLKLYKRVSIAREKDADLFISLHADSIGKSNVRGASIYTLSNKSSDAQTAKLAARENQVDLIAGVDLSHEDKDVANILIDLAMRDTMNQSKFFANTVVANMNRHGVRVLEKPHRFAGFAVLKAPDIPSVLVEMGFMSNNQEVQLLTSTNYQHKIAAALTDSIDSYFNKVQKNGVE